jgi:hypothetical protein
MKTATNYPSSTNKLTVRALRVKQDGKIPVFSLFMTASDLLRIAEISRIKRNKEGELLGYQRKQVSTHVDEITQYVDSTEVVFPQCHHSSFWFAGKIQKGQGTPDWRCWLRHWFPRDPLRS